MNKMQSFKRLKSQIKLLPVVKKRDRIAPSLSVMMTKMSQVMPVTLK
jgi:hypothetical protein